MMTVKWRLVLCVCRKKTFFFDFLEKFNLAYVEKRISIECTFGSSTFCCDRILLCCLVWLSFIYFYCGRGVEVNIHLGMMEMIAFPLPKLHVWFKKWRVVCSTIYCRDHFSIRTMCVCLNFLFGPLLVTSFPVCFFCQRQRRIVYLQCLSCQKEMLLVEISCTHSFLLVLLLRKLWTTCHAWYIYHCVFNSSEYFSFLVLVKWNIFSSVGWILSSRYYRRRILAMVFAQGSGMRCLNRVDTM